MKILFPLTLAGLLLNAPAFVDEARAVTAAQVKIEKVTPQTLRAAIRRNRGKVVLVNFWATWCSGCVKELPELAKLKKKNAGKMVVLLVAANETAPDAQVKKSLAQKGHSSTLLFRDDLTNFFPKFDPTFKSTIELPLTFIYARNGRRAKIVAGERNAAQYQALLNPYLK